MPGQPYTTVVRLMGPAGSAKEMTDSLGQRYRVAYASVPVGVYQIKAVGNVVREKRPGGRELFSVTLSRVHQAPTDAVPLFQPDDCILINQPAAIEIL